MTRNPAKPSRIFFWKLFGASSHIQALTARAEELERRIRELDIQRNQAEAILQSLVEGVVAVDRSGRILWLNESSQRLVGAAPDQIIGRRLTEFIRHQELEELISEAIAQRRPANRELRLFSPEERVIRFQAVPCEGPPEDAALVLVAQDVTEMRRLEGLRREFVANVSHELKTPLTSIAGLVETLLTGALEDPANNRRFVMLIEEETTRLSRLIEDLLQLSQIESRAVPLKLQPVALTPLIQQLWERLERQASQRGITLTWEMPAATPRVLGDPERLRQVFLNLLDNAIKFNRDGGRVTVRGRVAGAALQVEVEDTGSGIPEPDLARIFERFYRVDKTRSRELGGTGLGLAIVKHLVELHQGRIEVRSRLGQGSVFTLTLPLAPAA
ncbi:MAG: PAS domain-containing protein [Candidatus Omnitrophica bacterium]|nr:PAS domain-containing protein [Candidatus Omnitrophota bacterium]